MGATKLDEASAEREYARKLEEHALWLAERGYYGYAADERDDGQGWAVDVFDGRRAWAKTHLGEQPLNKAEAHRLAHKLRDLKFYTARTKRAVNSGGVL